MGVETSPFILFYPTGIVHFRNLQILKKNFPEMRFRVIVESWVKESAPEILETIAPDDRAPVMNGELASGAWEGVNILFLSMAYPNSFRLGLVHEAARRHIPATAIEEVNQLALNDGIINHYFLPLEILGVPSEVEKEKFLALGLPEETVMVTGWPFFNKDAAITGSEGNSIKEQYGIPVEKKCCVLVLGSLKEKDIVSLETQKVRRHILETVSAGLPPDYRLLIKPHPIETPAGQAAIKEAAPGAVLVNPKQPVEPLLAQADVVVNRGNSQVILLAMLQNKPLILVPAGLNTICRGILDTLIADTPEQFRQILEGYTGGQLPDYRQVLTQHFPLSQEHALQKARELFAAAAGKILPGNTEKLFYIAVLYAFLGDGRQADAVADQLVPTENGKQLKKLFNRTITPGEFKILSDLFPGRIQRWHLQALFIRALVKGMAKKAKAGEILPLLEGFDGEVNPHYFIEDIIKRVDLEYRYGNRSKAEELLDRFSGDYSTFGYYRDAFTMLRFVHRGSGKYRAIRKFFWLLRNFNTPYTRKYLKEKLIK